MAGEPLRASTLAFHPAFNIGPTGCGCDLCGEVEVAGLGGVVRDAHERHWGTRGTVCGSQHGGLKRVWKGFRRDQQSQEAARRHQPNETGYDRNRQASMVERMEEAFHGMISDLTSHNHG
jgi:hypothetical protein